MSNYKADEGMNRRSFVRTSAIATAAFGLGGLTEQVASAASASNVGQATAAAAPGVSTASEASAGPAAPLAVTSAGRVRGVHDGGIAVFKGIPYGASTGAVNRFKRPQPAPAWKDVRDALAYGPASPQASSALSGGDTQSEDCLVLNVWTPALADGGRRPVMVWLHGGGFSTLSGSSPMYDGVNLCKRGDVVVVTLNHRLNVFGYLHLGDIAGGDYAQSGNAGMLDIVLALAWVRDNAAAFGGDAGNVTIFGESGGGRKVSTLLGMPDAQGLFHRAIIQSGPGIHLQPRDKSNEVALAVLRALDIAPQNAAAKLAQVPAAALIAACSKVEDGFDPNARNKGLFEQRGLVPTVGIASLPEYSFDPVATPLSASVPLMIGTNRHELALFARGDAEVFERKLTEEGLRQRVAMMVGSAADRVLATYAAANPQTNAAERWLLMTTDRTYRFDSITLAQRKAALGRAPVYMYYFTWETPVDPRLQAHHALEIAFAFDNTSKEPAWSGGGADAAALADKMSDAWVQFARSGNPNVAKLPAWPIYDAVTRATMVFNNTCRVANDPDASVRQLWATV